MNFEQYLEAIPTAIIERANQKMPNNLLQHISIYQEGQDFPDIENAQICILGIPEDRNAINNVGTAEAPHKIREALYALKSGWGSHLHITDLGNLKQGHSVRDTYAGLETILSELFEHDILCIILGGSQDLTYANYKAYQALNKVVNIVAVDSIFDLNQQEEKEISNRNYLSKIILDQPSSLFNFTHLGYQSYFVDPNEIRLMEKLFFDTYRLGSVRGKRKKYEPLIRNADMLSFDISAIRMADAPGSGGVGPNGFDGVDACQIARYAGISNRTSSFGIYEYNPSLDIRDQTAQLIAQMVWYFLEGFSQRSNDDPKLFPEKFQKFYVKLTDDNEDFAEELLFYKNIYSGSWWMEVPSPQKEGEAELPPHLIPCSEKDFQKTKANHIPDRWFQFYKKLV